MVNPSEYGWRRFLWAAAIFCAACCAVWGQRQKHRPHHSTRLSNRTVEGWARRGLATAAITARIDSAASVRFDLSTRALLHLQRMGVPAAVMAAMIRRQAALRLQATKRRQMRRRQRQLREKRRALTAARTLHRRALAQQRALAHFGALGSPLHSGFRTRLLSRLAWIQARDAAGNSLGVSMGFLLGASEIAAPVTRHPPAMVRIRLGPNQVYARTGLLAWHRRAGVMLLKVPARTPPGLAAERFRQSLPRKWRPQPGDIVYWATDLAGNPSASGLQMRHGVLAGMHAPGTGDELIQNDTPTESLSAGGASEIAGRGMKFLPGPVRCQLNYLGHVFATSAGHWNGEARKVAPPPKFIAASGAGMAGAPVFDRRGLWLGMLLGCQPADAGNELCRMRPARTMLELSMNRRAMVLAAYRDATLPDRIYIEDQTGHHYGRRLEAELARRGWKFTSRLHRAQFYLRLDWQRRGRQRWETLQVYRTGPRRLRLLWSGAERIMLFRRSAARRLADDWLRGRIAPAELKPGKKKRTFF